MVSQGLHFEGRVSRSGSRHAVLELGDFAGYCTGFQLPGKGSPIAWGQVTRLTSTSHGLSRIERL